MLYLFQTIIYAAVFYLFYRLFLKDRPLHRFNRAYLLVCAVFPFLLPFAELSFLSEQESPVNQYMNVRMPEIVITDADLNDNINSLFLVSAMIYVAVSFTILSVNVYKWRQLRNIIIKAEKIKTQDYTLLLHTGYGPGSRGRYIFLPEGNADPRIIAHEAAHIRLKHTRDFTFLTVLQCLFWYHPFLHFIKKELMQVHEFEADVEVPTDKAEYQALLLHHFLQQCRLPFTHSFINHPIKRRIMMLNKNNQTKSHTRKMALAILVFLFFTGNIIWFQSCKSKKREVKDKAPNTIVSEEKTSPEEDKFICGKTAQPTVNIAEFLGEHIQYPEKAEKNKIEGKVVVKFKVSKEGKIRDVQVVKSPDELLSEEAIRVINLLPPWIPGEDLKGEKMDVYITQPINFKLGDGDNAKSHGRNSKTPLEALTEERKWSFADELNKEEYNQLI